MLLFVGCILYCISIHTSREGCDCVSPWDKVVISLFQSTHPVRDVTTNFVASFGAMRYFNPHIP